MVLIVSFGVGVFIMVLCEVMEVGFVDVVVYLYKDLLIVVDLRFMVVVILLCNDFCDVVVVCDGLMLGELLVGLLVGIFLLWWVV